MFACEISFWQQNKESYLTYFTMNIKIVENICQFPIQDKFYYQIVKEHQLCKIRKLKNKNYIKIWKI